MCETAARRHNADIWGRRGGEGERGSEALQVSWINSGADGEVGSPDGTSDTDHDIMDMDVDADAEAEADPDPDVDEEREDEDEDEQDQDDSQDSLGDQNGRNDKLRTTSHASLLATRSLHTSTNPRGPATTGPTSHPNAEALFQSDFNRLNSSHLVRSEALTASVYDIVPTIAAPHSTSINAITATPDLRWVFSGGSDGYIRKFNWMETANGKSMLTVAQKHPFVDSVTKAGVLMSYWENEDSNGKCSSFFK